MKTNTVGRPAHWDKIKRAHELREKGLKLTEISWALLGREDKTQIHRWLKRKVG